ncbi:MAG TPA: hypothetical protein VFX92_13730, partial [Candidatus Krumholzibacteria bacterium]|nr:hypothetical protein [Candidatus Krumholzibacteria bacterium]
MGRFKRLFVAASLLAVFAATPAFAGLGLHAGFSIDPDDFLIGARFKSHPIEERIHFLPIVEVGFGDITMVAGSLDAHYVFKTDSKYAPYAGGGITLNWFDYDGGSDTKFGGSILGGMQLSPKFFAEAKIG